VISQLEATIVRFSVSEPCPICGGNQTAARHSGSRCHGYRSKDRRYARCSRAELAGRLTPGRDGLYGHRVEGRCPCGSEHEKVGEPVAKAANPAKVVPSQDLARTVRSRWFRSRPANGTLVEIYLASRGIHGPVPQSLRFNPGLRHTPSGLTLPAMVASVVTAGDAGPVALHRTFLRPSGDGKAEVEPCRMALGPIRGGAVRLGTVGKTLAIAEGIETALSIQQATGIPTWAALSASNMPGLHLPPLPAAQELLIGADADSPGRRAAVAAADKWCREGRRVRIAAPRSGDFNDVLMDRSL
jgi:Toprim domain-containing protein